MFVQLIQDFLGRPAGERIDVSEADAQHLIHQGKAAALTDDPLTPLIQRTVTEQVGGVVEKALDKFLKTRNKKSPFAPGDDPGAGFKNFGEFAQSVKTACIPGSRPDERLLALQAKTISGMANINRPT